MRVIDYQAHWFPPAALAALEGRKEFPRVERRNGLSILEIRRGAELPMVPAMTDLEVQLKTATDHGIDVLVSSPASMGEVLHLDGDKAAELLDRLNAEVAGAQRAHADRFVGLAMLPMQDPDAALAVLERAIGELELRGVCVLATIEGRPVGSDETLPVFKRIEQLGVPVFLHPGVRTDVRIEGPPTRSEGGIGWMAQTAIGALSLVDSGIMDACPELVVLHPHLGGVLPYVAGRVERMDPHTSSAARPLTTYLRERFYVDTVSATPGALDLAIQSYGLDKILFGTDYPFIPMAAGVSYLAGRSEAEAIKANVLPGLKLPA